MLLFDRAVAAVLVASAVTASSAAGSSSVAQVPSSGLVETARVDVVRDWPFVVEGDPLLCSELDMAALRVTENGREVQIIAVEPALPLTTHVLMLDTSASMSAQSRIDSRKKGRQTKVAAKAYIDWMLEDAPRHADAVEALMVFTFDDDLILRNVRTPVTDRAIASRLQQEIDRITGGFTTSLNDSLIRLVRHLSVLPERSVIILLSDGADVGSAHSYVDVERALREANNVTLFPIGIGLPPGPYQDFLESLALISGGEYHRIRNIRPDYLARPLEKKFRDIRARVKSQRYVSWYAEPYDAKANALLEVRIHSLRAECKIPRNGYRPERNVKRRTETRVEGPPSAEAGARQVGVRLKLHDILHDSGPLIPMGDPGGGRIGQRTVEILLPPLHPDASSAGGLRPEARSPADVVHDWLLGDRIPEAGLPGPASANPPSAHEMSGGAFLDQRDLIAQAIFDQSEVLRRWAVAQMRARLRAEYEKRVLELSTDPAMRATILDSLVEDRLHELSADDYVAHLAGWHRDFSARELAFELEKKEANQLLQGGGRELEDVARVQERWSRLHDWLFFPSRVRVITPLEPIYDPKQDALQFFRIVLPRVGDLPEDPDRPIGKQILPSTAEQWIEYEKAKVPSQPFGLLAVRWLLGLPITREEPALPAGEKLALAREIVEHWRVSSMAHGPAALEERATGASAGCREEIRIELRPREDVQTGYSLPVRMVVDFDMIGGQQPKGEFAYPCPVGSTVVRAAPRCFAVPADAGVGTRLVELLARTGLSACKPTSKLDGDRD